MDGPFDENSFHERPGRVCEMPKGKSLFDAYPNHRVDLEANPAPVEVVVAGETVAASRRTLLVHETKLPAVVYFPREDVRSELLERTDHQSFCPFKGEASYWTVRVGDHCLENCVWSYEDPFDEVAGLKDYMAFYAERVEWR
jgi:uncharacterized protein (DUF427 family)